MVRMKGLEPPRLAAPDPKSGASANSATSAFEMYKQYYNLMRILFQPALNLYFVLQQNASWLLGNLLVLLTILW